MTNPIIATVLGNTPQIDESAFIAPNATVVGAVTIAAGASIWYGAVIRGDAESISIGADTNIQDNCTVHADPTFPAVLGERISVGHNAVLHGCTVERRRSRRHGCRGAQRRTHRLGVTDCSRRRRVSGDANPAWITGRRRARQSQT